LPLGRPSQEVMDMEIIREIKKALELYCRVLLFRIIYN
jgi:hypothetical protein